MIISVRVTPRASRDAIEGADGQGVLRVHVTAPPVDGAANRAVVKLIAATLRVPRSSVSVISGEASRMKRIEISGVDDANIEALWPGIGRSGSRG